MDDGPRLSGPKPADPPEEPASDGVWRPSWAYLALGLAVLVGGIAAAFVWQAAPPPARSAAAGPVAAPPPMATGTASTAARPPPVLPVASSPVAPGPPALATRAASATMVPQIPRVRDPNGDPTPDIADFVNPGERPTMNEVIERLHQAGVRGGLGAFSPPGTRPPRIGLAVPEDFVLPEGYVRHHQATDDGQRIEPILMFSPDHAFFDATGRPVAIPADRVVPPELAPPGLPIRQIVIPTPADAGRPGR